MEVEIDMNTAMRLAAPLPALLIAPIVFRLIKTIEQDDSFLKSDIFASLLTSLMCATLVFVINNYLKYSCHIKGHSHHKQNNLRSYQQRSFWHKFYTLFSFDSSQSSRTTTSNNGNSSFHCLHSNKPDENNASKRRIDSKYFKPKFIYNELVTFWDTTCTVITWGSFYLIGGTVVATEKIAQKIKAKRTNSREYSFSTSFMSSRNSEQNRSTGQNDSSFMSSFMSSSSSNPEPSATERNQTFRKISAWTKRSFASARRKFTRAVTLSVPQLTNLSMSSNLNSSQRSNS